MADKIETNRSPRFNVIIDGNSIRQDNTQGLEHLVVEDHVDMMGVCRVTLNLEGVSWDDMMIGGEVEVSFGGNARKIFKGYITGLRHFKQSGTETLTVIALDPLCKMGASRVTKIYEKQTDSDIVSALISNAKVTAGKVDPTKGENKYLIQRNESDFNLAKRLAARNGYLLMANEGKIDFLKAAYSAAPKVKIEHTKLISLDYTVSDQWIPPELTVIGWNYVDKKKVEGTAKAIDTIGSGSPATSETGQIWQKASYISDVHVSDQGAALAMAKAELNRLARNYVRGHCSVQGDGAIYAGVKIEFDGLREGFSPEAFVVSSKHVVEPGTGYITEFHFASNTKPV